ncbi:MAG: hypothetical protein MUQ00_03315 [Candidatus Aminicenantes bacterium]|nr:hypothetical protein [Candidatus Aminicenantes bacterium]
MKLPEAARHLLAFERGDLTGRLAALEAAFRGCGVESARPLCEENGIAPDLLHAAFAFKVVAGQINVLIHGIGILTALPYILKGGEEIQELSLGAGNTGRPFDLETTHRVAEFKFINWRGGAESIRQNSLFKDFFRLAEADTTKVRELYLLELDRPLRFLNGRRALASVLSRDEALRRDFTNRYGSRFAVARDYYNHRRELVSLIDITRLVPAFVAFLQLPGAGQESGDEATS